MKRCLLCIVFFFCTLDAFAQLNVFENGQPANAGHVNENFTYLENLLNDLYGVISIDGSNVTTPANLTATGSMYATAFYYTSDQNLKKDVQKLDNSLAKIKQLRGVSFKWKKDGQKQLGLIAQEVEKVFPELVHTNEQSSKSVQYGNLVAPLIESIKEMAANQEQLQVIIQKQQQQINHLLKVQTRLEQTNEKLNKQQSQFKTSLVNTKSNSNLIKKIIVNSNKPSI